MNECKVARRERVAQKCLTTTPGELGMLAGYRLSDSLRENEVNLVAAQLVGCREKGLANHHGLKCQFFLKLPRNGFLNTLAGMDFSAGKLPKSPVILSIRTTADQQSLFFFDYRRNDRHGFVR